jgi:hypothetical protein
MNIEVYLVGYLYNMDLINARKMEDVKNYSFFSNFYISDLSLGIINVRHFMLHEHLDRKIIHEPF